VERLRDVNEERAVDYLHWIEPRKAKAIPKMVKEENGVHVEIAPLEA
jgi:hypothetical protein